MPKLQTTINALKGTIKFVESRSVVMLACDDSFVQTLKDALEQLEEQKKLITCYEQSFAGFSELFHLLSEKTEIALKEANGEVKDDA